MTRPGYPWRYLALGTLTAALGLWLVTLWLPGWLVTTPATGDSPSRSVVPGTPAGVAEGSGAEARHISATLFYVAASGDALIPVEQNVAYAASPTDQARRLVERQLGPAPAGHVSAIPAGAVLRGLYLTGRGEAYVDVSPEIMTGHPGGSQYEFLTVYAIVNALTVNIPDITAVQVLVDGREVDTLVGHLDLRQPLRRGLRWVQRTP